MATLRVLYRNLLAESVLLFAIVVQIYSGLNMFGAKRQTAKTFFEKLSLITGLYPAMFFVIHLGAVYD